MRGFVRHGHELYCEDVSLEKLAKRFGTPLYVYSRGAIEKQYGAFEEAFRKLAHQICFSVKANSNIAVLRLLANMGAGADVVSGGELFRARAAGISPMGIVYSGVGKRPSEMKQALEAEILLFNIESVQELEQLNHVAGLIGRRARIACRINPSVDPRVHPYVATGLKQSKFGIPVEEAREVYRMAASMKHIEVVGVDFHIGSQLTEIEPFRQAIDVARELIHDLRRDGHDIRCLDLGGGLGIQYSNENPPSPLRYGEMVCEALKDDDVTLILEPGRNLVGNAGALLSTVLYTKRNDSKRFVVVDAAMNDLLRPSHYEAYHKILPVMEQGRRSQVVDVVGPICESGDFLARERKLPELRKGDLLSVMSVGAYGFSMASTYNSRPLAAEVLVSGREYQMIRARGTYDELIAAEQIPDFLK